MLKEIKKKSDVITNQDLFHEIIEKVKESEKWPSNLVDPISFFTAFSQPLGHAAAYAVLSVPRIAEK